MPDPQKSEVHESTGDAASSPTSSGDRKTTRAAGREDARPSPKRQGQELPPDTEIVRDDSDSGGPVVIKSDDPDLRPPKVPKDPFPTERKPEIDPPVK